MTPEKVKEFIDNAATYAMNHPWFVTHDQRTVALAVQQAAHNDTDGTFVGKIIKYIPESTKMSESVQSADKKPMEAVNVQTVLAAAQKFVEFMKDKGPVALQALQLFLTVFGQAPTQNKMQGLSEKEQVEHMKTVFCECCDECVKHCK